MMDTEPSYRQRNYKNAIAEEEQIHDGRIAIAEHKRDDAIAATWATFYEVTAIIDRILVNAVEEIAEGYGIARAND